MEMMFVWIESVCMAYRCFILDFKDVSTCMHSLLFFFFFFLCDCLPACPPARLYARVDGGGSCSSSSEKPPFMLFVYLRVCVPYGFILANRRAVTDGTDGDAKGKLNQPHGNQHEIERKRKPETVHDLRVKSRHGQDEDCEIEHRSLFIDGV